MSSISSSEGFPALMDDLIRDLSDSQLCSVRTIIRETVRELSVDRRCQNVYNLFQYIKGMALTVELLSRTFSVSFWNVGC